MLVGLVFKKGPQTCLSTGSSCKRKIGQASYLVVPSDGHPSIPFRKKWHSIPPLMTKHQSIVVNKLYTKIVSHHRPFYQTPTQVVCLHKKCACVTRNKKIRSAMAGTFFLARPYHFLGRTNLQRVPLCLCQLRFSPPSVEEPSYFLFESSGNPLNTG